MSKDEVFMILIVVIIGAIIFPFFVPSENENTTEWVSEENENSDGWFSEVECTVKDKWVKRTEDVDKYLVSCDDEVYEITDNLLYGKVNSSDIYAQLKIGSTYKLEVSGFRSGLLSSYRNINKVTLIGGNNNEQ